MNPDDFNERKLKPRPITASGRALLALMRLSDITENRLQEKVRALYLQRELHEVSSALMRPCPDAARLVVASEYERLTDAVVFRERNGYFEPCYSIKDLGDPSPMDTACLIGASFLVRAQRSDLTEPEVIDISAQMGHEIVKAISGLSAWQIDFPVPDAFWHGEAFPGNLKLNVLFELMALGSSAQLQQRSVLDVVRHLRREMLERRNADPLDRSLSLPVTLFGYARRRNISERGTAALEYATHGFEAELQESIEDIERKCNNIDLNGYPVSFMRLDLFSAAQETAETVSRGSHFLSLLDTSRERATTDPLVVSAVPISRGDLELRLDALRIGVWRDSGAFVYGTEWVTKPRETMQMLTNMLTDIGQSENIPVCVHPQILSKEVPTAVNATLYPTRSGDWLDPKVAQAGAGAHLLKTVNWTYPGLDDLDEARMRNLPMPRRFLAAGLVEMIQQHYVPDVYRKLKELLSDLSFSDELVTDELVKAFPTFAELLHNAPHGALPTDAEISALRWHWTKSPLFLIRPELTERLQLTDLGLDVEASFAIMPYPLFYIHFPGGRSDLSWVDVSEESLKVTGAFVHQHGMASAEPGRPRILDILFCADSTDPQSEAWGFVDLRLTIEDEAETLEQVFQRWVASNKPEEMDDEWVAFSRILIDEVLKILVYLGMRDARKEDRPERTKFLKTASNKTPGQRLTTAAKARWLFDYIYVGPEESVDNIAATGLTNRKVKPHFRRGHRHTVCYGRGREQRRLALYPPVIVNADMIGHGVEIRPKDYIVR